MLDFDAISHRWQLSLCTYFCGPRAEGGGASHSGGGGTGHAGGGDAITGRGTTSPSLHKGWVHTGSSYREMEMLLITFTYSCQI